LPRSYACSHGCHFKTRNGEYKRSCHESSIRIPTAFSGGAFAGGGKLDASITLLDFAPSLLDACAIPVPDVMQGRSFLPLLSPRRHADPQIPWPTETFVQISEAQIGRAVRTRRWKYGVDAPQSMREHYLEPVGSASTQYQEQYLYDLQTVTLTPLAALAFPPLALR
jgi:arylsulfatase A-like enzyme